MIQKISLAMTLTLPKMQDTLIKSNKGVDNFIYAVGIITTHQQSSEC